MAIMLRRFLEIALVLTAFGVLGGCATSGNPKDPLEGYNRAMFEFNEGVDKVIIKPVATGYKAVMPEIARTGVTNFFANLDDLWIGINNVLQGKIGSGISDLGRFLMNSTVGILGLFDVASNAGLEKHNEDLGQTLGRWGVEPGPYFVIPLLGASTVRDGLGRIVDWRGDALRYVKDVPSRNILMAARIVNTRATLLDTSKLVEDAALDRYTFVRDAYLQRRRSLVYDGEPPRERDPAMSSEAEQIEQSAALPPAQFTDQWGGKVTAASEEELTPAREFAGTQAPPADPAAKTSGARDAEPVSAIATDAEVASARSYEPRIPENYDAVIAVSGGPLTTLAGTRQNP
jgi:phospholipid-binding lipoprotein MlaA